MNEPVQDWDLLQAYIDTGSEQAFSQLVDRHLNMVYSACLRQVHDPHLAEDAAQAAFMVLARKARKLHAGIVLSAWLYNVARFTAMNAKKMEIRRSVHERKAVEMAQRQAAVEPDWYRMEPMLDEAVAQLNERDRCAVILRFFEQRSFREVGQAMGASEAAAEMRVWRAVDKLRSFFHRRNVALPALAVASLLWANSVHAAPASLGAMAGGAALAGAGGAGAAGAGSAADEVAQETMREMAWAATKAATLACAAAVLAVVVAFFVIQSLLERGHRPSPPEPRKVEHAAAGDLKYEISNLKLEI